MSEKQTTEAGNSLTPPYGSACECQNWADLDLRVRLLTGHNARCQYGCDPLDAAFKLLKELTRGIECWAHEEDGVPECVWDAYRKAKALQGVFLSGDPNASVTGAERA